MCCACDMGLDWSNIKITWSHPHIVMHLMTNDNWIIFAIGWLQCE
jgi:hypothetical protein